MTMLGRCAVTFPAPRHQRDHDDENGDQRQLTSTQGTTPSAWAGRPPASWARVASRSEEHTSELQSLMRISYAVFCLKKKNQTIANTHIMHHRQYVQKITKRFT